MATTISELIDMATAATSGVTSPAIASGTAMDPFSPEHAAVLARADLLDYFNAVLSELNPTLQKRAHIKALRAGLEELHSLISLPEGKAFTEEQVKTIYEKSSALVKLVTSGS